MLEATYRRNLNRSYMCVEEQGSPREFYELRMLENQNIAGLLKLQTTAADGSRRYLYDISGMQQMEDYLSGRKMDCGFLKRLLCSLQELCKSLPEYLLRESGICLESEFIYVNLEDGSLHFTYLPFYEKSLPEAFEGWMEQVLRRIDHQDSEAVELGYQVYQHCTQENANLKKVLEAALGKREVHERAEDSQSVQKQRKIEEKGVRKQGGMTENTRMGKSQEEIAFRQKSEEKAGGFLSFFESAAFLETYFPGIFKLVSGVGKERWKNEENQKKKESRKKTKARRTAASFEKDAGTSWTQPEEKPPIHPTEILGAGQSQPAGKLTYQGIHKCEDILLQGETFLLGKNREQVDGIIEAEGISRLHARITRQGEQYYLEDLNSTNGTYLNEIPLEYHQPQKLNRNDHIRFGAEEYVFS